MMVVAHVAVGAAVGSLTGDPVLAFIAGTASHFVMDAVPHFDPGTFMEPGKEHYGIREYIWGSADLLACLGFIAVLAMHHAHPALIIAGGIGGLSPDAVLNTPFWKEYTRPIPGFHWVQEKIHQGWHRTVLPTSWLAGVLTQLIAIGGSLWLLGF